jgi:flagellar biosynthesis/type III secretory pathway M-ring protein FliF/YscJ
MTPINWKFLKDKKVLIGLGLLAVILLIVIIVVVARPHSGSLTSAVNSSGNQPVSREMTAAEKNRLGLSPNTKATVVDDRNGNFIYKLEK